MNHRLEVSNSSRAGATEVDEVARVVESFLEGVDDFLLSDIHDSGAFVEEPSHVLTKSLVGPMLDEREVHSSTMSANSSREVAGETIFEIAPAVDRVLF